MGFWEQGTKRPGLSVGLHLSFSLYFPFPSSQSHSRALPAPSLGVLPRRTRPGCPRAFLISQMLPKINFGECRSGGGSAAHAPSLAFIPWECGIGGQEGVKRKVKHETAPGERRDLGKLSWDGKQSNVLWKGSRASFPPSRDFSSAAVTGKGQKCGIWDGTRAVSAFQGAGMLQQLELAV